MRLRCEAGTPGVTSAQPVNSVYTTPSPLRQRSQAAPEESSASSVAGDEHKWDCVIVSLGYLTPDSVDGAVISLQHCIERRYLRSGNGPLAATGKECLLCAYRI